MPIVGQVLRLDTVVSHARRQLLGPISNKIYVTCYDFENPLNWRVSRCSQTPHNTNTFLTLCDPALFNSLLERTLMPHQASSALLPILSNRAEVPVCHIDFNRSQDTM